MKDHPDSPQLGPQLYSMVQQSEPGFTHCEPIRSPFSFWTLLRFVADLLLVVPPLVFLVYGFLVLHNEGKPIDTEIVRELQSAAKYGPTVFPIAFAAIAGSFLKSFAAWKLERGISVLSLEYLLSCRTVFSAVTTPFSLRAFNFLTPLLLVLWALSPLGGQAAFRVIGAMPNTLSLPWDFTYLDYNSNIRYQSPTSSAGAQIISGVVGAFTGALLTTQDTKLSPRDPFGNPKIPMVEACKSAGARPDSDGWYNALPGAGCNYSSLIGLPAVPRKATGAANMSFALETLYTYTDCALSHSPLGNRTAQLEALNRTNIYRNTVSSFGISALDPAMVFREGPQRLVFTSFTSNAATNASCKLTTTYVEARVFCHNADCKVDRVRESENPRNRTTLTVFDGISSYDGTLPPLDGYIQAFVKAPDSPWDSEAHPYSTPIEYYFTHPESPYSAEYMPGNSSWDAWRGADIYPIGDMVFSQRFSQLLNTFWLSSIAPIGVTRYFNISSDGWANGDYGVKNATGEITPDYFVLECHRDWLAILVIASATMLIAALAAAVFGLLRRGPEILDRASLILRDNPHANVPAASTTEDGFVQARRLKDVRLCLGDVKAGHDRGHVAVGTIDAVTPLHRVKTDARLY